MAARLTWPLRNVWLGCSAEDQTRLDERVPLLLQTPAAVRFVSAEPLLGPLNLNFAATSLPDDRTNSPRWPGSRAKALDWVIVGGESGPRARPCNVEWVRSIVSQCREAGVSCFVKQLGAVWRRQEIWTRGGDSHGGDPSEWPEDLRVREEVVIVPGVLN